MTSAMDVRDHRKNNLPPIIAESPAMQRVVHLARAFALTDTPILLVAPTGCGKELLAQHIHLWSGRGGSMVDINCAALPEHLVESELFGHDGQAYTGARRPKPGLFEVASGGTLFLDEVSSLPFALQSKLLRVLETGELRRVGETAKRQIDVRILAAAQESLPQGVASGGFRRDVYQRLAGAVLAVPPLVERPQDLLALARHFAKQLGRVLRECAEHALLQHEWPGNVRELRQVVERATNLVQATGLLGETVVEAIALGAPSAIVSNDERSMLLRVCQAHAWESRRITRALGISRTTLYYRLKAVGLSLRDGKRSLAAPLSGQGVQDCSDVVDRFGTFGGRSAGDLIASP